MSPSKRKLFRVLFWGVLLYTAFSTTIVLAIQFGLIPTFRKTIQADDPKPSPSYQASLSEGAYAQLFTKEFLWWNVGKEEVRKERLKGFLANNMDPFAGLDIKESKYDSYVHATDVWSIKERPGNQGIKEVTVYAEVQLINAKNSKDVNRVVYYLVVPIMKSGESFRVVDNPYFIPPPSSNQIASPKNELSEGEMVEEATRGQVEKFLQSFWKVYFMGNRDELAYFVKSETPMKGYDNTFEYVEMKDLKVYKMDKGLQADCKVTLRDPNTKFLSTVHYRLELLQEGDRWYVTQIKIGEV